MPSKTISIVGGTGAQGGAVAQRFLSDPEWTVRILTRDLTSERAQRLAAQGAQLFGGKLSDRKSLLPFFEGADVAFIVTQFWDYYRGNNGEEAGLLEFRDGKNAIDIALQNEVPLVVLSSLDDAVNITESAIDVPHFDFKAALEAYAQEKCETAGTVLIPLWLGMYMENFQQMMRPRKSDQNDGSYVLAFNTADVAMPLVSVADIGPVVYSSVVAENSDAIALVGEYLTGAEICAELSRSSGKVVRFVPLSDEQMAAAGGVELANMFRFYRDFKWARDHAYRVDQYPGLRKFRQYLEAHPINLE